MLSNLQMNIQPQGLELCKSEGRPSNNAQITGAETCDSLNADSPFTLLVFLTVGPNLEGEK